MRFAFQTPCPTGALSVRNAKSGTYAKAAALNFDMSASIDDSNRRRLTQDWS
jgi:hypothetical protein